MTQPMEESTVFRPLLFGSFALLLVFILKLIIQHHADPKSRKLPPSPPSLPILGHLHLLKEPLHLTLHNLSEKYGSVLFLKFGVRNVLVVSDPLAVEECFSKNDIIFANRPRNLAGKYLNYDWTTMGFSSYGDHWRNLRRLTALEVFSSSRIATFTHVRRDEVSSLMKELFQDSQQRWTKVEMTTKFRTLIFNILTRMIAGKRYYGKDSTNEEAKEFVRIMTDALELQSAANIGDYLPIFQWIDFQGLEKQLIKVSKRMDLFCQHLIEEARGKTKENAQKDRKTTTIIDVMLSLQEKEPQVYTDQVVKGSIVELLVAGTETASTALDWAMALLVNNPEKLKKAQEEIEAHVQPDHLITEQDLPNLTYLQNILYETLRLYPPTPLLVPHLSSSDCNVLGYHVPKGTMLFVNLWTTGRDPKVWEESARFIPERFEVDRGGEGKNSSFKFIPFGSGRRACPGANLGKRMVELGLGALIQCFEWKRIGEEEVNMDGGKGLSMPRTVPLEILCRPRESMTHVLSRMNDG